jgi:transcriptional regulator with XRE-family HTH domain
MTRLKLWRTEKGWTLYEAAGHLGLSRASLHLIENGRLLPSDNQQAILRRFFGSDCETLLEPVHSDVRG